MLSTTSELFEILIYKNKTHYYKDMYINSYLAIQSLFCVLDFICLLLFSSVSLINVFIFPERLSINTDVLLSHFGSSLPGHPALQYPDLISLTTRR